MDLNSLLQNLSADNYAELSKALSPANLKIWIDLVERLSEVDQILPEEWGTNFQGTLEKCLQKLTNFGYRLPLCNINSLVMIVHSISPDISHALLMIIEKIFRNELIMTSMCYHRDRTDKQNMRYFPNHIFLASFEEILYEQGKLQPVPKCIWSIPALSKFPICDFKVACANTCTPLPIKQRILCISAHFEFAVLKIFSIRGKPCTSRQMMQVLQNYFGDIIIQKLLK